MRLKLVFILIAVISLLSAGARGFTEEAPGQPQDPAQPEASQEAPAAAAPLPASAEPEVQWLWGEVIKVDLEKNELLVKYVDYDTDTEKEALVVVTDKTTYENAKSILEIKPRDMLSIDYAVDSEGKNIAKNIGVEITVAGESS